MLVQVAPKRILTALKLSIALNACVALIGGPVAFAFNAVLFELTAKWETRIVLEQPVITLVLVGTCIALSAKILILLKRAAPM